MRQDLDTLKTEIEQSLDQHKFAVFRGQFRGGEGIGEIYWDSDRYPHAQDFLDAAAKLDVKVVVFHDRTFTADMLSETVEKLDAAQLPRDEHREIERSIRKLRGFDGFTCSLQLSFDFDHNTYIFEARTKWYEEFLALLDDLDAAIDASEDDDESGPVGGYYSHN